VEETDISWVQNCTGMVFNEEAVVTTWITLTGKGIPERMVNSSVVSRIVGSGVVVLETTLNMTSEMYTPPPKSIFDLPEKCKEE